MKKYLFIACTLLVASCAKAPVEIPEAGSSLKIVVNTDVVGVKTSLSKSGSKYVVNWNAGDHILLSQNSSSDTYTLSSGDGSTSGTFTVDGTASISSGDVVIYYPSTLDPSSLTWPSEQTYTDVGTVVCPMRGEATISGDEVSCSLAHLGAVLELKLTCLETVNIASVSLAADQGLSGAFTVSSDAAVISGDGGIIDADFECRSVSGTQSFFFAVPAGTYSNFYIRVTDQNGNVAIKKADNISFARATCVPVSFTLSSSSFVNRSKAFSVSASKKVYISKGNLQWQGSTGTWRFARHQWDVIGKASGNTTSPQTSRATQEDWIDLFNYGTSGVAVNGKTLGPHLINPSAAGCSGFYVGDNAANELTGTDTNGDAYNADWGYNKILNGGNENGLWFTPSLAEWKYMMSGAGGTTSRGAKTWYGSATVNGVFGYIILPDEWTDPAPNGKSFVTGYGAAKNTYTAAEWLIMEDSGAVFYPECGYRSDYAVTFGTGTSARYHLSSVTGNNSYYVAFSNTALSNLVSPGNGGRGIAKGVRLMRVAE